MKKENFDSFQREKISDKERAGNNYSRNDIKSYTRYTTMKQDLSKNNCAPYPQGMHSKVASGCLIPWTVTNPVCMGLFPIHRSYSWPGRLNIKISICVTRIHIFNTISKKTSSPVFFFFLGRN